MGAPGPETRRAGAGSGGEFVLGVDGGGTGSRVAVADGTGRELLRRAGDAGLIDPRDPASSAAALIRLVRAAAADARVSLPAAALCAGLAGSGSAAAREQVRSALLGGGVADRVAVVADGEIALEGALGDDPGILLVAGTGSIAWGRAEDGRTARCGGWGMVVGDEGSGYAIARDGIRAALAAADGRGAPTGLLPAILPALGLQAPEEVPAWVARADKATIAGLAPRVIRLAEAGDEVAAGVLDAAAMDLARHVQALLQRLGPWSSPVPVVFHGGALGETALAARVDARLRSGAVPVERREPAADAVAGAVRMAVRMR